MNIEQIAKTCHEVNKAYCESQADKSQLPWDSASEWQQESAINGVVFHFGNSDSTPEDSHNNWMNEKYANGWKYGIVKDPAKKEHPCLVEYSQLPDEQKVKDALFIAVVRSFE